MALYDDTVLNINVGHFYLADTGTAAPTTLATPGTPWAEIGHTSLDNIFGMSSEGGDATTLGTLQSRTLRSSVASIVEHFTFNLQQFDVDSLKLYFGSNSVLDAGPLWLAVPDAPIATEKAFLAVFTDGTSHFAFYAARAEIRRGDDFDLADTTSLASLPIEVTPLNYQSSTSKYSVTALVHATT